MAALHPNLTSGLQAGNDATTSSSQASGPTVFWALLAIAMNAMGQESPTVDLFLGPRSMKGWLLVPYLSSPIVCLCDIAADCYALATKPWRTQDSQLSDESTRHVPRSLRLHNLIAVRTILVVFAVIPQVVKLYGITDIPGTQVLATVYLAVALIRLVKSIIVLPEVEEDETVTASSQGFGFVALITAFGITAAHVAGWHWLWRTILASFGSKPWTRHIGTALIVVKSLCLITGSAGLVWITLWTANLFFDFSRRMQSFLPGYVVVAMLVSSSIQTFLKVLGHQVLDSLDALYAPLCPMVLGGVCSWLLAVLLSLVPRIGVGADHAEGQSSTASDDNATVATTSNLPVEDLEHIKDYTWTEDARHSSDPNNKGKSCLEKLDECILRSMWFLFEEDLFDRTKSPSPGRTWPTDSVTKCRIVVFYWRRFMLTLPRALLEVFRPQTGSVNGAAPPNRSRGIRGVMRHLFYIVKSLIEQNVLLCVAMMPIYVQADPLSQQSRDFFFRISNRGLTFVIFNLVTAGMWYSQVWDGTGTTLPNWVSWLG